MHKFTVLLLCVLFSVSFVFAESFTQLPVIDLSKQPTLESTATNTSGNESGFIQITPPQYTPNISKVTFYSVDSFWALLGLSLYPVDTNLNVGIGTSTPTAKLTVVGTQGLISAGTSASATGISSLALGEASTASGNYSTAIGPDSIATGHASSALGSGAAATGNYATAIGFQTEALSNYSTAIGSKILVNGKNSVGIGLSGDLTNVSSDNVFAILGGNVGIGTGVPSAKLNVLGDSATFGNAPWALRVSGGKGNLIENTSNKAGSGGSISLEAGRGGDGAGSGGQGGSIYFSGGQGGYVGGKGGSLHLSSGLPSQIPPISGSAGDIYISAGNVSYISGETQMFYPNGKIILGSLPTYFTLSPQGILINGTINSTGDVCIIGGPCLSSVTSGSGARATVSAPAVVGTSGSMKVYAVSATQFFNSSKGFSCQQFCVSKGRTTSCTGADDVTTLLSVTNTCADVNLNDKYCACTSKYILK